MEPSSFPAPEAATRAPDPPAALPSAGLAEPSGSFVTLEGEEYYRIEASHRLRPFLMTLASDTDLWMFVTSGGGLTAGRRDPDGALFPYETVDRLHDGHHHTGPITLFRVEESDGTTHLWEPFAEETADRAEIERSLYKSVAGTRLIFEEHHASLRLRFRYRWAASDEFGWVRTATLESLGERPVEIALLDGLRNVLPHGAPLALYQHSSCLVDAYKRVDCDPATRLAIYSLTSKITDRAEAAEELRATAVWSQGLEDARVYLSLDAVAAFRRGAPLPEETTLTGRRGNYLIQSSLRLPPGGSLTWHVVADVGRSHVDIAALRAGLLEGGDLGRRIEESLANATANLTRMVAGADGLQHTGAPEAAAHHFANVLFNCMRGGVFLENHAIPVADLTAFVHARHRSVAERHEARLAALLDPIPVRTLIQSAEAWNDADLLRLCHEYLPLTFARRHGDPSRPWNRFSIRVRNPDGSRALHYEGNWRDIFQNWEALCLSFPDFLPSVIAKFVNASTVDGFNPYRITRDGIDWEVPDPESPWSHIGYWGDHQIVYLLRLLEALHRVSPATLEEMLPRRMFSFAEVPYRLKPYGAIVADPKHTIEYDADLAARIEARVSETGADGRLLRDRDGAVLHANLMEKLFIPALSKLSNFVPGGGIWMNTQRPEWNDANNALAGHGLSMVTLYHLRRYLGFLDGLVGDSGTTAWKISAEVAGWMRRIQRVLNEHRPKAPGTEWTPAERKRLLDALGTAFSDYRAAVYERGFEGATEVVPGAELRAFLRRAMEQLDHSIRDGRREDGLYHSYNILEFTGDGSGARVQPLEVMLEGQVAALASGVVSPPDAVGLVSRLFESPLYRPDQKSFMLYPEKELPSFLERNRVPEKDALAVPLLRDLLDAGDRSVLERDALGVCRFQADLQRADDLAAALDRLARRARWRDGVARDRAAVRALFERVFRHHAFTGRSGAMYAYEGLGSIYWHMVAKLLLAVQDLALEADRAGRPTPVRDALADAYFRIREGLGFEKSVSEYGAFPTDPYSHTPAHAGAQQPGMTGQVKELVLARFAELGVAIDGGLLSLRPVLLRRAEFLSCDRTFPTRDPDGTSRPMTLPAGSLGFTLCGAPVIYRLTSGPASVRVIGSRGTTRTFEGSRLDAPTSRAIFERGGDVARIEVDVPEASLRRP